MSGNKLLLDTNILLYLLAGDQTLVDILQGKNIYISFITELELLSYNLNASEKGDIEALLSECIIVDINSGIKKDTIQIRQAFGLKLPDAIIAATSQYLDIPLISADKGFGKVDSLNLVRYEK
ncbi:twitching motility protein PilT [Roseivirga seohaensis]|uniref:Ribonuclease VapC n=1 Tax=Roseivirga seohaensis TaxID=1914963 RepID=A0A150XZS0_9BACT|nr:type II toxin-antitoxin system VapC family toxin [Roseivirga seohaensis]KYG84289.1 twitching motility protein PilT [Roseivirga seohaensis]